MKGIAIVYIRRIVLCIVTPAFCGLIFISYVSARPSASIITKAFYQQHFRTADRMFFSRENVRRERRWFTPRLYKLMLYELHRADLNERDSDGNLMKRIFPEMYLPIQKAHLRRSESDGPSRGEIGRP